MRVNFQAIEKFVDDVKKDPELVIKQKSVTGQCNFQEGRPHFEATVEYAKGTNKIASDQPPFMGGGGTAPDPVNYCLYGTAACFAGTMMVVLAQHNLTVDKLAVTAFNQVNLSKPLGLGDFPIVDKVGIRIHFAGPITEQQMNSVVAEAVETCPGAYCISHAIPLETSVVKE